MDKKAILALAGKVTDAFPDDITSLEVRQVLSVVQSMYPQAPPPRPAVVPPTQEKA